MVCAGLGCLDTRYGSDPQLSRMELDSLNKQMESRLMSVIVRKLKARPKPEPEETPAGVTRYRLQDSLQDL